MQVKIITTDEPAETIVGTYLDEDENDIQVEEWGERRVISRDRISHYSIIPTRFRVTFETNLSITVLLDAEDEESAADAAWKAANAHLQTYPFARSTHDGATVLADAELDGIGADEVAPVDETEG